MSLAAAVARPSGQDTDDLDLVAAVRAGDERAFEQLYLRYQARIAAYVRSMVRDHGRAEDITQEVFISALRRMRQTDCEIAFKPWVYEIAKNACIDAFRRSRHCNEVSFDAHDALGASDHDRLAGMGVTPDAAIDAKVDLDNLRGAFGGLSELHHQILVMRELDGQSYRDIGERLRMSRPAVESTLFRARRRLGEEYDELVSGKRCLRVRAIVDAGNRSAGVRDQRRMDRHLSHCQPCRRYALAAGVDLEARPSLRPAAAKIAALVPLPAIVRRRFQEDAANQLLGSQGQVTVAQWSAHVAGSVDPGTLAGWSKAVVAAAAVAVAGVGGGAAITEREALRDFISRAPTSWATPGDSADAARERSGGQLNEREDASLKRAAGVAAGRQTAGGAAAGRPAGSGGTSGAPDHSTPATTGERHPAPAGGGSATSSAKTQGADDAPAGTPEAGSGNAQGGSATDSSQPTGGVAGTVGDVVDTAGGTGSKLTDGGSSAKPVVDVVGGAVSGVTNTVGGVLPGR